VLKVGIYVTRFIILEVKILPLECRSNWWRL